MRVRPYIPIFVLFVAQAAVLLYLGQPTLCECGDVFWWEGNIHSSGMSQHVWDWYTFSHIVHGFLLYALLRYLFPKKSVLWRVAVAVGIEAGWEILENTPTVIEHYRQQALANGYVGDSIVNSLSDTVAMLLGFVFASRARVRYTIALAIFFEIFTLVMIRDNLTLNVVNLVHVVPVINEWQAGA